MRLTLLFIISVITVYWLQIDNIQQQPQRQEVVQIPEPTPVAVHTPAPPEVDVDQLHCLATNIYHEARGESYQGKIAVANVVMNRIHSNRFPGTFCDVVYQAKYSTWWQEAKGKLVPIRNMCQFSWFCDGKSDALYLTDKHGRVIHANLDAWQDSVQIATQALRGNLEDITQGATHYHANYVKPSWSRVYKRVAKVDNHLFYVADNKF